MIWTVARILFFLFLPRIIRWFIGILKSIFSKSKPDEREKKDANLFPLKSKDSISGLVLLALLTGQGAYDLYMGFGYNHPNFYKTIGSPFKSQYYMTRLAFRKYAETRSQSDSTFPANIDVRRRRSGSYEDEVDSSAPSEEDPNKNISEEFWRMQRIFEKLTSKTVKRAMYNYGEEAVLNCDYCVDPNDYFYFLVPSVALVYVWRLIVWGIATQNTRKQGWRSYGVMAIIITCLIEMYIHVSGDDSLNNDIMSINPEINALKYENVSRLRSIVFGGMVLFISIGLELASFVGYSGAMAKKTTEENVSELVFMARHLKNLNGVLTIQRNAVLMDGTLRKHLMNHLSEWETSRSLFAETEEYKSQSEKIFQRHDIASILREAESMMQREISSLDSEYIKLE